MNEQLIVKNFGPIKDATVDFKRVTVFIGPTGGGKSTLAKLAAIFRDENQYMADNEQDITSKTAYKDYSIQNYFSHNTSLHFLSSTASNKFEHDEHKIVLRGPDANLANENIKKIDELIFQSERIQQEIENNNNISKEILIKELEILSKKVRSIFGKSAKAFARGIAPSNSNYIPAERIFAAAINSSVAGLMRDDIGLPKPMLNFINLYLQSRDEIDLLRISFLEVEYFRHDNKDYISLLNNIRRDAILLGETASGIQSVTPMLVMLEHMSRNTEQAQSFIIEEPELNLYPTAQQGLLNWLVEKCTKGDNDLTITTHSPYLLAHFNTLLFAYQVAQNHPERADEIAKVVPRESWINPAEFAAYHVEGQQENGVRSIVNPETGLISYNGLDAIASAEASEFEKLLDINAGLAVEW